MSFYGLCVCWIKSLGTVRELGTVMCLICLFEELLESNQISGDNPLPHPLPSASTSWLIIRQRDFLFQIDF